MPMNSDVSLREEIIKKLTNKAQAKGRAYEATLETFTLMKDLLKKLCNDVNEALNEGQTPCTRLEYCDKGKFETEIKVAGDILIFSMHSNVFQFDRSHLIWKTSYVQKEKNAAYCGVISIYNFLVDSIKYNRIDDLGYLTGRIFINKDKRFFVDGKRQIAFPYNAFGEKSITADEIKILLEKAVMYSIESDMFTPPYDTVKEATVGQMNMKIENAKLKTGKRIGFKFNSDNILASNQNNYYD